MSDCWWDWKEFSPWLTTFLRICLFALPCFAFSLLTDHNLFFLLLLPVTLKGLNLSLSPCELNWMWSYPDWSHWVRVTWVKRKKKLLQSRPTSDNHLSIEYTERTQDHHHAAWPLFHPFPRRWMVTLSEGDTNISWHPRPKKSRTWD